MTMDDFSPHVLGDSVANVPVYDYAGWFDAALPRGQVRQFLANHNPGSRLRLGPWFHAGEFNASPYANGRNNDFDHAREVIRFFDYHLRNVDNGFSSEAPVQYYTMGDERWKSSSAWPPPGSVQQSLFLAPSQRLSLQAPAVESAEDSYHVDEAATSGLGSRWGLIVGTGVKRGYGDQRDHDRRLITYTTPPLQADLEVTGHPVLKLFLSANASDGAVFAYLQDVRPDGEVRYVTEGELRLVHRALGASPLPSDPVPFHSFRRGDGRPLGVGEVAEVVLDLLPTSFVFGAGHAVRLAIAGADTDSFEIPQPVSKPVYELRRDRAHPSHLELPTYSAKRSGR